MLSFLKSGAKVVKNTSSTQVVSTIDSFVKLIEAYKENHKVTEEQETIRRNIEAQKEVTIEEIRAKKELMLNYFDNIFKERKETYKNFFEMIDKGIETGNMELVQMGTNSIVHIVTASPLKELGDFRNSNKLGEKVEKIENFSL